MKKTSWKYLVDILMFLAMIGIILIGLLLAFVLQEGPALKESDKFFLGLHRHQWTHIHLYMSLAFSVFLVFHLILEWSWIKGKSRRLFRGAWRHVLGLIVTCAVLLPLVFWAFLPKNAAQYYEFGFGRGQGRGSFALTEGDRRLPAPVEEPEVHQAYPVEEREREETPVAQEDPAAAHSKSFAPDRGRRSDEMTAKDQEHGEMLVSGRLEADQSALVITGRTTLREVEAMTSIPARRLLAEMALPLHLSRDETLGRLRRRYGFSMIEFRSAVEELMEKK